MQEHWVKTPPCMKLKNALAILSFTEGCIYLTGQSSGSAVWITFRFRHQSLPFATVISKCPYLHKDRPNQLESPQQKYQPRPLLKLSGRCDGSGQLLQLGHLLLGVCVGVVFHNLLGNNLLLCVHWVCPVHSHHRLFCCLLTSDAGPHLRPPLAGSRVDVCVLLGIT